MQVTEQQPGSPSFAGRLSRFSLCGMCSVRCPIEVQVEDGRVRWLQGNARDAAMGTSLCPKGAAGVAFQADHERPRSPMIRDGARGGGDWREVEWDEALDYVAERLAGVRDRLGARAILLSDRGGPFTDLTRSFLKAIGSPNYFDHDSACGANAHHATRSLFGLGRTDLGYDYPNSRHVVLYGRNLLESLQVKEVKAFLQGRERGAKVTYIDPRFTVTAAKADRWWQIRPNSDYALNLAIIRELLTRELYDKAFVARWVTGMETLRRAVADATPEWAERRTGIPAQEIRAFVREVAAAAPRVLFHAGWMSARHRQSFYVSRTAHVINCLLGAIGAEGGVPLFRRPRKGLNRLADRIPDPAGPRVDGAGGVNPHWDPDIGLAHRFYHAMGSGEPYPVGAWLVYRHDPLTGFPDPEAQKRLLDRLELLVSIDVNWSETAWYADVLLPESTYLERDNILGEFKGDPPFVGIRQAAVEPRCDSRPAWWIFRELARRLGAGEHFAFDDIEAIWRFQLEGTGIDLEQLKAEGVLPLDIDAPVGPVFKTPSGKIEFDSGLLAQMGLDPFPPFQPAPRVENHFWLLFGRVAQQAHGQSGNNPLLHELLPENELWIHPDAAAPLGIADGARVRVSNGDAGATGRARVTPRIHPEAVFMLHGFGRSVPLLSRSHGLGMADQRLQLGKLFDYDPAGGGFCLTETQVRVEAAE